MSKPSDEKRLRKLRRRLVGDVAGIRDLVKETLVDVLTGGDIPAQSKVAAATALDRLLPAPDPTTRAVLDLSKLDEASLATFRDLVVRCGGPSDLTTLFAPPDPNVYTVTVTTAREHGNAFLDQIGRLTERFLANPDLRPASIAEHAAWSLAQAQRQAEVQEPEASGDGCQIAEPDDPAASPENPRPQTRISEPETIRSRPTGFPPPAPRPVPEGPKRAYSHIDDCIRRTGAWFPGDV